MVGRPSRSSLNESTASSSASATGSSSGAAPKPRETAAPSSTAMPPVRGTGRSCSERAFGRSSANAPKRDSSTRTATNATTNDRAPDTAGIAGILASAVPLRRGAQSLLEGERRTPAELTPDRASVGLERPGELLQRQPARRERQQPCRPPERDADRAAKRRRGR